MTASTTRASVRQPRPRACAECDGPTPPGRTYCSTRCRNAGDPHDTYDYQGDPDA